MLTWATSIPTTRMELERFFFEMYCEELCDATGDLEEDKPIEVMEAEWQRIAPITKFSLLNSKLAPRHDPGFSLSGAARRSSLPYPDVEQETGRQGQ